MYVPLFFHALLQKNPFSTVTSSFLPLTYLSNLCLFSYMMADSVAFKSQVVMTNDSGESLTDDAVATAERTATRVNDGGLMSAMNNRRGSLEISWGFGLDKGRRTAMEDAIAIVPEFLSPVGWKDGGSVEENPLVHYFGLFDGHGGSQVLFVISDELNALIYMQSLR